MEIVLTLLNEDFPQATVTIATNWESHSTKMKMMLAQARSYCRSHMNMAAMLQMNGNTYFGQNIYGYDAVETITYRLLGIRQRAY